MGDLSNEPSMEDILASIKKIISEDGDSKVAPSLKREAGTFSPNEAVGEQLVVQEPDAEEDVLDLNAEDEAAPVALEVPPVVAAPAAIASGPTAIVSPDAAAASRSALASLSNLLVKPEIEGSDTLQGLVREMLKPMMKEWLDEHLPAVVERIVSQEVGRISGRVL